MIDGLPPAPVRAEAPRVAAPAAAGNALPSPGADRPVARPVVAKPPDRSRSVEVLDRYLADSQRSLEFLHDPDARQTIILVVDAGSGEVVRQIPAAERMVLARHFFQPRPTVIDLSA